VRLLIFARASTGGRKSFGSNSTLSFVRSPPPLTGLGAERERSIGERPLVQIFVRDNNVDQALKALKKKMQREGSFREMKRHVHYEKPSEKRARQKAEAIRRARKLARKRAQREGLIAAPKKPPAR
jgi:small subunit ribosomal protein S21